MKEIELLGNIALFVVFVAGFCVVGMRPCDRTSFSPILAFVSPQNQIMGGL
jgi:hypothetical protein